MQPCGCFHGIHLIRVAVTVYLSEYAHVAPSLRTFPAGATNTFLTALSLVGSLPKSDSVQNRQIT